MSRAAEIGRQVFRILIYCAVLAEGFWLAHYVRDENFTGGVHWVAPILAFGIPVALVVAHLHLRARDSRHAAHVGAFLIMLLPAWYAAFWVYHLTWIIPHRVKNCPSYERRCDDGTAQPTRPIQNVVF